MMAYSKTEPFDIYDFEVLLYIQEVQLNTFKQELASPSATTNIVQGANTGRGANAYGFYHHARGWGKQSIGRGRGCQTQAYTPGNHPTYQLYNKYGHSLIEWWHKFDEYYESVPHKNHSQSSKP